MTAPTTTTTTPPPALEVGDDRYANLRARMDAFVTEIRRATLATVHEALTADRDSVRWPERTRPGLTAAAEKVAKMLRDVDRA